MHLRFTGKLLALVAVVALCAVAAEAKRGWELLGEMNVTDRADHDTLIVTGARGTFRSIKLRVHDRDVQFHDMKIHFANGGTQDVALRRVIRAGGESRPINIHGRERTIRSIEFRYDAQSLFGKSARVAVWGLN
jgi:hypothetical protein